MNVEELINALKRQNPKDEVRFRVGRGLHCIEIVKKNESFSGMTVLTNQECDLRPRR